jgi:hypothetical protein
MYTCTLQRAYVGSCSTIHAAVLSPYHQTTSNIQQKLNLAAEPSKFTSAACLLCMLCFLICISQHCTATHRRQKRMRAALTCPYHMHRFITQSVKRAYVADCRPQHSLAIHHESYPPWTLAKQSAFSQWGVCDGRQACHGSSLPAYHHNGPNAGLILITMTWPPVFTRRSCKRVPCSNCEQPVNNSDAQEQSTAAHCCCTAQGRQNGHAHVESKTCV